MSKQPWLAGSFQTIIWGVLLIEESSFPFGRGNTLWAQAKQVFQRKPKANDAEQNWFQHVEAGGWKA